jgi:TPP-dependent 2-oxoacid decarboxylase
MEPDYMSLRLQVSQEKSATDRSLPRYHGMFLSVGIADAHVQNYLEAVGNVLMMRPKGEDSSPDPFTWRSVKRSLFPAAGLREALIEYQAEAVSLNVMLGDLAGKTGNPEPLHISTTGL